MPEPPWDRESLEEQIRRHGPVHRKRTIRVDEGPVSDPDAPLFVKDSAEYQDDDGNIVNVELFGSRTCDNHHFLGTDGNEVVGTCSICRGYVCSAQGCATHCVRGHLICVRHGISTPEGIYCPQHYQSYITKRLTRGALGVSWALAKAIGRAFRD